MNPTEQATPRRYPLRHRILGLVLRSWIWSMRILPAFVAYGLADLLTPVLVLSTFVTRGNATRKHRGFYWNTRVVFRDELLPRQRRRLLWAWARHMTHFGIDFCRMPRITADNVTEFCDIGDLDLIRPHFALGRGFLIPTGHVGVFEYAAHLLAIEKMPPLSIFKESPIPIITDVINEVRRCVNPRLIERDGAVRELLRELRDGGALGLVIDVSSKHSEMFAPFLGISSATNNTSAVLHMKTGAPGAVITVQRTGRQRYKLHVWEVIEALEHGDRNISLQDLANRINAGLTAAIVAYPEQWFWDSRRFRTRPKDEVLDADGLPPRFDAEPAREILHKLSR